METNIYTNNKALKPFYWLLILPALVFLYSLHGTDIFNTSILKKTIFTIAACIPILIGIAGFAEIWKNKPLLTFNKDGLAYNKLGNTILIPWPNFNEWNIVHNKDSTYLVIQEGSIRHSINVTWMDAEPTQLERLIEKNLANGNSSNINISINLFN